MACRGWGSLSSTAGTGDHADDETDPFTQFARENRDWVEERADPEGSPAEQLLAAILEEDQLNDAQ